MSEKKHEQWCCLDLDHKGDCKRMMKLPPNAAYPNFKEIHVQDDWCPKAGCVPVCEPVASSQATRPDEQCPSCKSTDRDVRGASPESCGRCGREGCEDCHDSWHDPAQPAAGRTPRKFRKKPVVIIASKWRENGDHPEDACEWLHGEQLGDFLSEGKVVRYFRRPDVSGETTCRHCGDIMHNHGWIDTKEGGHIVCPGDWIITGVQGERYPCKDDIFRATYEVVDAT